MQSIASIPDWNQEGLIPPYDPKNMVPVASSPYIATLPAVVNRFGTSEPRLRLLNGLLRYRAMLHQAGLIRGFQWIDGSFVVNKENTMGAPPGDIDVVTFFELPTGVSQADLVASHGSIFDRPNIKSTLKIDSFYVVMDYSNLAFLMERCVYWSGFFGHTRDDQWKGFVQIDLEPGGEPIAEKLIFSRLNRIVQHGP